MSKHSERVEAIRVRLNLPAGEDHTLRQAVVVLQRLEDAGDDFKISNVLSSTDGRAKLDVVWGGHLAQMEASDARAIGWMFVEAAAAADSEEQLSRYLRDELGLEAEKIAVMMHAFRRYRDQADREGRGSLVVDTGAAGGAKKAPH